MLLTCFPFGVKTIIGVAGMAELVVGLLGPAIEVVKYVAAPIKRQCNYICCFSKNIQNLRDEAKKLDDVKKGLQMQVEREKDNQQIILPEVETWLTNSEEMKSDEDRILNEVSNIESGCLKLRDRFYLSRRAKKTADQMKEHRDGGKFSPISQSPPPAATQAVLLENVYEFESRKHFEEDIMETLRSMDVSMIGICGMGGVGKTTMAKRIMNWAHEEHLFDEVVMVVFSQQVDKLRIQVEIGRSLGLELEKESEQSRAHKLHARLSGTKRILLVLDDVWSSLSLKDLGIPCESGCKILVTSRNKDVLRAMNVPKICGLQILLDDEAWQLFGQKVGVYVDAPEVKPFAEKVVKECKGLPIALETVSVALKNENNLSIWKDALRQLTQSNPSDIPEIISEVYNPLKMSYDFLNSDRAKSIFLLCCLFPEDDDIPLEHLTYCAVGLRMLEGILELEEARDSMCGLIKMLKNRFLLLDGSDEYHVRMHDVIRDVSIFIASEERLIKCNDCRWISSYVDGRSRLPVESDFPNLRLVLLNTRKERDFRIKDNFIGRIKELDVLFMRHSFLRSVTSLPQITQLLKNLVTLVLYNFDALRTISDVGHCVSLEILVFHSCSLTEVPVELRGLKRLRLLQISECWNLHSVAPGVISSFVALEELKMVESFREWEADVDGIERENAGLEELEALNNLRCLEIQVLDFALAGVQLRLSPKLVKFNVKFGGRSRAPHPAKIYHKKLYLKFSPENNFCGDLLTNTFVRSTEYLYGYGRGSNVNLKLAKAQNIKWLNVVGFENMKNMKESVDWRSGAAVFPLLEYLRLEDLDNLEEMWDGPIPSNSFKNLKQLTLDNLRGLKQLWNGSVVPIFTNLTSISITSCDGLGHVFSSANAKDFPLQLERIEINYCDLMEHVVVVQTKEEEEIDLEGGSRVTIFPKLKTLSVHNLPKLMSIFKGIESIEFPQLTKLRIQDCPNINCLVSTDDHHNLEADIKHDHYQDLDSTHLFCQPKVSFSTLKELTMLEVSMKNAWCGQVPIGFFHGLEKLTIGNYSNIRSLFSSSIAQNLVNLQKMTIRHCDEMVKVIEDEKEKDMFDGRMELLFPKLQELNLWGLPKLEAFCEWRCVVELPLVKMVNISNCPELRSFNAGSVATPLLQTIRIHSQDLASVKDINAAIQQHFAEARTGEEGKRRPERKRERQRKIWKKVT